MTPEQIIKVRERARTVYTEAQVEMAIDKMASAITAELADRNPLLLCVMTGAVILTGKLAMRLDFPLQLDYLHVTRYRGATSGGELLWKAKPQLALINRVILIIDDILDEGLTLDSVVHWCREQGAAEVYTAVLVVKHHAHKLASIKADFAGLEAEDEYLVGYGMDYKGYLRNAPGIFAIDEADR
ncbi:MAG: hypoxanthine-guanine phosphoribosyltransferase [Pseudohongiellaceae bacterium]